MGKGDSMEGKLWVFEWDLSGVVGSSTTTPPTHSLQ